MKSIFKANGGRGNDKNCLGNKYFKITKLNPRAQMSKRHRSGHCSVLVGNKKLNDQLKEEIYAKMIWILVLRLSNLKFFKLKFLRVLFKSSLFL